MHGEGIEAWGAALGGRRRDGARSIYERRAVDEDAIPRHPLVQHAADRLLRRRPAELILHAKEPVERLGICAGEGVVERCL